MLNFFLLPLLYIFFTVMLFYSMGNCVKYVLNHNRLIYLFSITFLFPQLSLLKYHLLSLVFPRNVVLVQKLHPRQ